MFIDIEGFSPIYRKNEYKAINLLSKLMNYIYKIGTEIYSNNEERLFAYQIGDGFIISPNFEKNPIRAISISLALMKVILINDGVTRAAISTGKMTGIVGCYPKEIQDNYKNGSISLGTGIMTINPVMGDALINAYKLESKDLKGPLLLLDNKLKGYIRNNSDIILHKDNDDYCSINWIYSKTKEENKILNKLKIPDTSVELLSNKLSEYINKNNLSKEWIKNAENLINN